MNQITKARLLASTLLLSSIAICAVPESKEIDSSAIATDVSTQNPLLKDKRWLISIALSCLTHSSIDLLDATVLDQKRIAEWNFRLNTDKTLPEAERSAAFEKVLQSQDQSTGYITKAAAGIAKITPPGGAFPFPMTEIAKTLAHWGCEEALDALGIPELTDEDTKVAFVKEIVEGLLPILVSYLVVSSISSTPIGKADGNLFGAGASFKYDNTTKKYIAPQVWRNATQLAWRLMLESLKKGFFTKACELYLADETTINKLLKKLPLEALETLASITDAGTQGTDRAKFLGKAFGIPLSGLIVDGSGVCTMKPCKEFFAKPVRVTTLKQLCGLLAAPYVGHVTGKVDLFFGGRH